MSRTILLPAVVLSVALGLAGFVLTAGRDGAAGGLARASFDLLHVLEPGPSFTRSNCPVVLVYLDVESHLHLRQNPAERWDRALHTRLLERLTDAGARAVVFDVIFDAPWPTPDVDRDLAAAIRRHGRVILAAERVRTAQATGNAPALRVRGLNLPQPELREAARAWGAAEVAIDSDFVVRESLPWLDRPEHPTLARAALLALRGDEPGAVPETGSGWLRYYGPPLTLPHVSYRNALDPAAVDAAVFRDRVVFVGSRPMVGAFGERRDELRHPYSAWVADRTFMPGVEVHATQFLNGLRGDGLRRAPGSTEALVAGSLGLFLGMAFIRLRPIPGALVAGGVVLASWAVAELAFVRWNLWFPWLVPGGVLAPAGWLAAAIHHTRDWRRQRSAFEARRREDARRIERQAALIERARDLILVTDLAGGIRYANPSAGRLLGLPSASGFTGHAPFPTLPIAEFETARDRLLAEGSWSGLLIWNPPPPNPANGPATSPRLVESRWTLLRESAGEPDAILVIGTDVTEQRRLEADFLRAQKWEAVGSLAGGMAHDLNNSLAPALLGLQILQRSEPREEIRRVLAMIETHTRRGTETVQQVLGFLRGGGPTLAELDPVGLVRELEVLIRSSFPAGIRVSSLIAPQVGRIRGNATQLHQALLNLCLNARDAMPAGGELTFAIDEVDLSEAEAAQWNEGRPGAFVLIAVSDTGGGITPELLDRIFDPLFTTKETGRGTGLGLASVLRIVRQHAGFVGVTSDVGAGSTFELYLPRLGAGEAGRP